MDFTQNDIWVKDGNRTTYPKTLNYDGVVSRESIHIIFTHADLNLTPVKAVDICSKYLQAPTSEKHYIFCGPEFRLENMGKRAKIV